MRLKHSLISLIAIGCFTANVHAQTVTQAPAIIPQPVSLTTSAGNFVISQETVIAADSTDNKAVQFLASFLQERYALHVPVKPNNGSAANAIVLTTAGTDNLPPEGYKLTVTPAGVTIAGKGAGLFYGIQTLIQLIPLDKSATLKLPCVQVEDYPRFGYRGLHLDVSRHFFSVEFVKKYLDLMAAYKLNNFHWHLTDDQGWRIEIKKYPRLTQVGSQRAQTLIGNLREGTGREFDNTPYGGFYTQDQIRDVVKYAADRYINVIPEIEMPGHSQAALAAYPELSCDPNRTYDVAQTWGVFGDVYCPSEKTFSFLEDVLTEVMQLFPSKYIHIGGDEVPTTVWHNSAFCQHMIKRLHLKDEHGLQSYFIQRIEKFLNSKGRSIIGWDEILEGGLAPNATVMSWRGESGGIAAARQNHNVIMTPGSGGLYFDNAQGKLGNEPLGIGGYAPLQKTYSYNPTPAALTPEQQKYIIGVQANLWTEYIATEAKAEYMLLPRMLALSEIAWTPLANKNYINFSEVRLPHHLARLDMNGFDYRVPQVIGLKDTTTIAPAVNINLKPLVEGAKIFYTIDGYATRETDLLYEHPFTLTIPLNQYRELQTMVITPAGLRSTITKIKVYNTPPLPPVAYTANQQGLKYQLYNGKFANTAQMPSVAVADTGIAKSFNMSTIRKDRQPFGVIFNGFIRVDADGKYLFSTQSDDGSVVSIDDQQVVDNDGRHNLFEQGGEVLLQKGYHRITIKYFDAGGPSGILHVYMTMPGKPKGELSPADLYY